MRRRRIAGVLLIALGTITVALSFSVSPAGAQAPDQAGWWFELKTKALPVPVAVPTVPDGGLFVQQGPNGPTAYGAVRARVPGAASATLLLTAAQGSTTTLGAPLQACATSAPWAPTSPAPGDWEDAPKYGNPCTFGAVSSDGKAVAFYFETQFFPSGVLDVAIAPQDGATPFAIAFDKPADDSLTTKVAAAPAPAPTTKPSVVAHAAPVNTGGSKPPVVASPAATPAPPPTTLVQTDAGRSPIASNVLKLAGLGDPDRGARAAALGGASVIVVGWWLLSTQSVRLPRLLGGMSGAAAPADDAKPEMARIGGVARFARKRDRNALPLR